jgi:hypothetical protein
MIRLNCIVEGQTEEKFVNQILKPFLAHCNLYVSVRCVETKRTSQRMHRGGMTNYLKAKNDINRWLKEHKDAYLTTMFDYYGLPNDFPCFDDAQKQSDPYKKVEIIQNGMASDIGNPKFIPYIQLHEFEALLFSNTDLIDQCMQPREQQNKIKHLNQIINQYETPEHINSSPTGAPSKRLESIYKSYDKVIYGSLISETIGLDIMRQKCVHFSRWIEGLLALSSQN